MRTEKDKRIYELNKKILEIWAILPAIEDMKSEDYKKSKFGFIPIPLIAKIYEIIER